MSKRSAEHQLTKDDYDNEEEESSMERGMDFASAEDLAQRKIRKVKRKNPSSSSSSQTTTTQSPTSESGFTFVPQSTTEFKWDFSSNTTSQPTMTTTSFGGVKSIEDQLKDAKKEIEDLKQTVKRLTEENERLKKSSTSETSTNSSNAPLSFDNKLSTSDSWTFGVAPKQQQIPQQKESTSDSQITPTPQSSSSQFNFDFGGNFASFSATTPSFSQASESSLPTWGEDTGSAAEEQEVVVPFTVDPAIQAQLSNGPVSTGEEDEQVLFSEKCKLFELVKVENSITWQERGRGTIKLNTLKDGSKARIVMRKEAVLTVLLNVPVFKQMKVQKTGKGVLFNAPKDANEVTTYTVKFQHQESADRLNDLVAAQVNKLP
mgnify:CR=1 FL=1